MKKLLNRAFLYAVLGLAFGVFYREFTKFRGFEGRTMLAFLHPHLLVLGALFLLLALLLARQFPLLGEKHFRRFLLLHDIGLPLTALMMLVRGVLQVLETPLSRGLDAALAEIEQQKGSTLDERVVDACLELFRFEGFKLEKP